MVTQEEFEKAVEGCEWLGLSQFTKGKTFQQFWDECEEGAFMLDVYVRLFPDNVRERVLAAGHCAATVLHLMKDQRSKDAVQAAIDFGEGKIERKQLSAVAIEAAEALERKQFDAVDAVDADAVDAVDADAAAYAADAAHAAAAADYAAGYTFHAANAASYAAANAREESRKQTADICRKYLKVSNSTPLKQKIRKKDLLKRIERLEQLFK